MDGADREPLYNPDFHEFDPSIAAKRALARGGSSCFRLGELTQRQREVLRARVAPGDRATCWQTLTLA